MKLRTKARETALQALYACDFFDNWGIDNISFALEHVSNGAPNLSYSQKLCFGIQENRSEIDKIISQASTNWTIGRMSRIDRCLLRISAYEILKLEDVPISVSINEAIELSKLYSSPDSPVFINGVLDKIASIARETVPFRKNDPKKNGGALVA